MAHSSSPQTLNIEALRARFERWRDTRQRKGRIPEELWSAAVEVARRDGVGRTAAVLHLDGGKLKKSVLAAGAGARKPAPPTFLELVAPRASGLPGYTIELEGRHGTLRIHCQGVTAREVAELSRTLWSVGS